MKYALACLLLCAWMFAGCARETISNTKRPYVYIVSAKKIGNAPRANSDYDVLIHYKNVGPGDHEISLGFGYIPSPDSKIEVHPGDVGIYRVAYTKVIHDSAGELHATIGPRVVNSFGTMDGKLHVILSKYPHGSDWHPMFHDVFALEPE